MSNAFSQRKRLAEGTFLSTWSPLLQCSNVDCCRTAPPIQQEQRTQEKTCAAAISCSSDGLSVRSMLVQPLEDNKMDVARAPG
jgi:hypothetical protein